MKMNSSRPYLLRAMHEWIVDNHMTPHVLVNAAMTGVQVPKEQIKDGRIVLNLSPGAVQGLDFGKTHISLSARFRGIPSSVSIPMGAVLAIYARENGKGMLFPDEEDSAGANLESSQAEQKPRLTIVK